MNFEFTEEQIMVRDSVARFIQDDYGFDGRQSIAASEEGISRDVWGTFAELGWLTVPFSEEDGGFGGSAVDLIIVMEEFGKGMVVEPFIVTAVLSGSLISALGTEEQKEEMLPAIMEGRLQLACANSESGSRYNLSNRPRRFDLSF